MMLHSRQRSLAAAAQLGRRWGLLVVLTTASLLLLRSRQWWPGFVDESDNFLGGYVIARGYVLYRDYFSHHMPLPYYLAAVPSFLGASSVADYRTFTSIGILS